MVMIWYPIASNQWTKIGNHKLPQQQLPDALSEHKSEKGSDNKFVY
jgi:hypothetical protein